jgi:hypothetical protein
MSRSSLLSKTPRAIVIVEPMAPPRNANMAARQPGRSGSMSALPQFGKQHKRSIFPIVPPFETKPSLMFDINPKQSSVSEHVPE